MGATEQKFKIGDRVRRTTGWSFWHGDKQHTPGSVGIVSGFNSDGGGDILIFEDGIRGYANKYELAPAWQPKVGDRVRLVKEGKSTTGAIGKLATLVTWDTGVFVDNGDYLLDIDPPVDYETLAFNENFTRAPINCFELAPTPAPLTVEAGKFYKTRDGRKVGPVKWDTGVDGWIVNWGDGSAWDREGTVRSLASIRSDLVALWQDEPAQPAAAVANDNAAPAKPAKFKVGDRVRVTESYADVTAGKLYVVAEVDEDDETMPIRIAEDDKGDPYWLNIGYFEPASPPTATPAIVALIENGVPKPSERPFVHETEAAAAKEAARLAGKHKGQKFGVFVLTTTSQEEKAYDHEWQNLAAKGEKIPAIKALRDITGMGLKPAKDAVEYFLAAA